MLICVAVGKTILPKIWRTSLAQIAELSPPPTQNLVGEIRENLAHFNNQIRAA
jgi:hypothetical protein